MNDTGNTSILKFAEWILQWSNQKGIPFSHLKLQKILYYCQAWHLVFFDKMNLYSEAEIPEAWSNGPVFRKIYDKYKDNQRSSPLVREVIEDKMFFHSQYDLGLNSSQLQLIENVLNNYGAMSDEKLVYLTHVELPWNEARAECMPFATCTQPISLNTMHNYYKSRLIKVESESLTI